MLENPDSRLWEIGEDNLDPLPIAKLAKDGDSAAMLVYSKIGYYLGKLIWNLKRVCAPDAVSFSGNIARSLDLMLPSMKMVLNQDPLIEGQPVVQTTSLGEGEAGIYGAGGLAIQAYKNQRS
jgi:predicted NBD/HSP70 family sugar kinase